MGFVSLALVVLCAMVWPSQTLNVPDSCSLTLNPYERTSCGSDGTTRDSCLSQGCCYDDYAADTCAGSTGATGACFKPANCEAGNKTARVDCGWAGITREMCNCKGCCFDGDAAAVKCFEPYPNNCEPREFEKTVIAMNNYDEIRLITEQQCKDACANDASKRCKTAEYYRPISRCFLSEKTYEDAVKEHLIRTANGFIMFAVCPETAPTTTLLPDGCDYQVYDNQVIAAQNYGKLLATMTLEECKNECNKDSSNCNSFEYNKRSSRCFLSGITYAEGDNLRLIRSTSDFVMYSCPYDGPAFTTPPPTLPPTEPPIITNETETACIGKQVDMMFVLDESSSIAPKDFQKILDFSEGIAKKLPIAMNQTKVGCITFSSTPATRFQLSQGTTSTKVKYMLRGIKQRGGNTYTDEAIRHMMKFMVPLSGARDTAQKIGIILTDGASKNATLTHQAALAAHAAGIKIIAVGVGDFDATEIDNIASDPNDEFVFTVDDFDKLVNLVQTITLAACQDAPLSPEEPVTAKPEPNKAVAPPYCKDIPVANRTNNPPLYMIDSDGPDFGADPYRVECDFSGPVPVTIVHNNQEERTCSKMCEERDVGCFVQTIEYLGSIFQVAKTVKHADSCTQDVYFDCRNAAIDYRTHDPKGPYTYWSNIKGEKMNYWPGGALSGGCACGKTNSCAVASEKCNCDARDGTWRSDSGTLTDLQQLPIREIAIGDVSKENQQGCFRMSALRCI